MSLLIAARTKQPEWKQIVIQTDSCQKPEVPPTQVKWKRDKLVINFS